MSKKKYTIPSVSTIKIDSAFMLLGGVKVDSGDRISSGGDDKDGTKEADSRKNEVSDSWNWE